MAESKEGDPSPTELMVTSLPTQEISPESLDELFQRDPRKITDEEFEVIILHYRSQRGRFIQAEKEAQAQGKKQTRMPKQVEGPKVALPVSLADLEIGTEPKP